MEVLLPKRAAFNQDSGGSRLSHQSSIELVARDARCQLDEESCPQVHDTYASLRRSFQTSEGTGSTQLRWQPSMAEFFEVHVDDSAVQDDYMIVQFRQRCKPALCCCPCFLLVFSLSAQFVILLPMISPAARQYCSDSNRLNSKILEGELAVENHLFRRIAQPIFCVVLLCLSIRARMLAVASTSDVNKFVSLTIALYWSFWTVFCEKSLGMLCYRGLLQHAMIEVSEYVRTVTWILIVYRTQKSVEWSVKLLERFFDTKLHSKRIETNRLHLMRIGIAFFAFASLLHPTLFALKVRASGSPPSDPRRTLVRITIKLWRISWDMYDFACLLHWLEVAVRLWEALAVTRSIVYQAPDSTSACEGHEAREFRVMLKAWIAWSLWSCLDTVLRLFERLALWGGLRHTSAFQYCHKFYISVSMVFTLFAIEVFILVRHYSERVEFELQERRGSKKRSTHQLHANSSDLTA